MLLRGWFEIYIYIARDGKGDGKGDERGEGGRGRCLGASGYYATWLHHGVLKLSKKV